MDPDFYQFLVTMIFHWSNKLSLLQLIAILIFYHPLYIQVKVLKSGFFTWFGLGGPTNFFSIFAIFGPLNFILQIWIENYALYMFVRPFSFVFLKSFFQLYNQLNGETPSCIVTCVGGGGLAVGLLQGLQSVGWHQVRYFFLTRQSRLYVNCKLMPHFDICVIAAAFCVLLGTKMCTSWLKGRIYQLYWENCIQF